MAKLGSCLDEDNEVRATQGKGGSGDVCPMQELVVQDIDSGEMEGYREPWQWCQ